MKGAHHLRACLLVERVVYSGGHLDACRYHGYCRAEEGRPCASHDCDPEHGLCRVPYPCHPVCLCPAPGCSLADVFCRSRAPCYELIVVVACPGCVAVLFLYLPCPAVLEEASCGESLDGRPSNPEGPREVVCANRHRCFPPMHA